MAEAAERAATHARRRDPPIEASAERHAALERRAADQPAAGYGALLNARPAGPRPAGSAGVVQRYRKEGDAKASVDGGLFLAGPRELYAGEAQFAQANAIGGQIAYAVGAARHGELREVRPEVVAESGLDKATRAPAQAGGGSSSAASGSEEEPGYSREEDLAFVERGARAAVRAGVLAMFEANHKALLEKDLTAEQIAAASDDIEEAAEKEARRKLRETEKTDPESLYRDSPIIKGLNAYLASQEGGSDPLVPSDCRAAATFIAGFDPEEGEVTEEVSAGVVYRIVPAEGREAQAQWTAHYGTVIMTDRLDHVTLENAGAKVSDGFKKLQFDRTWFFEMYGPEQDQSFGDKYGPDMDRAPQGGESHG
ncbi:MAG: hypothetical protein QOG13_2682 [Sphingomonadales bacterium]|jgi:hypothetical protein|nr:hypothetical protein [Sphingomonadales bacterium]